MRGIRTWYGEGTAKVRRNPYLLSRYYFFSTAFNDVLRSLQVPVGLVAGVRY